MRTILSALLLAALAGCTTAQVNSTLNNTASAMMSNPALWQPTRRAPARRSAPYLPPRPVPYMPTTNPSCNPSGGGYTPGCQGPDACSAQ